MQLRRLTNGMIINANQFIAFIVCVCCVAARPATGRQSENTPSQMANHLRGSQTLQEQNFETTFEVRIHDPSPVNESLEKPESWVQHDEINYIICQDAFIMNRSMFEPYNPKGPLKVSYRQTIAWFDGESRTSTDNENSVSISASTIPGDLASLGYLFNHIDGRFPAHLPLSSMIEKSHPISFVEDDTTITYRFALDLERANSSQMSVTLRKVEGYWQLVEYRTELSDAPTIDSFDDHVYYRNRFHIESWQDAGQGNIIPKVAELSITGPTSMLDHSSPQITARTTYTRKSFSLLDDQCAQTIQNPIKLVTGTKVYDNRLKLSYEIGRDYLYWDGTLYQLNEPLLEPPNDRLDELLASANAVEITEAPDQGENIAGASDPNSLNQNRSKIIPAMAASGGMLFLFGLFMLRRQRKMTP